jgi:uncharacterized protein
LGVPYNIRMTQRYLKSYVEPILSKKMLFLGGPRQSGKTTFAKTFLKNSKAYLNWDFDADRELILKNELPLEYRRIVLDEIHKYPRWRNWIKGYYDKYKDEHEFFVTGSARLDLYRKGGDSLQGRYRYLRLYPFSFREVGAKTQSDLNDFMNFSAFPEPFLEKSKTNSKIWSRDYRTRLIREDLLDLEKVNEVSLLEKLLILLPKRVGSPLSLNAIREDLSVSFESVKKWIEIYERLYAIFRIYPYQHKKLSALKKEAKHYHFDWTVVENEAARFENLIAFHLLKHVHFLQDTKGENIELYYHRDREKREVDFLIANDKTPLMLIEVKQTDKKPSDALIYLKKKFPQASAFQVLQSNGVYQIRDDVKIISANRFLREFIEV